MKLLFFLIVVSQAVFAAEENWTERFQLFGDFRWRSQTVRREATPFRYSDVIRVRPGLRAHIEDHFSGTVRLSLGEAGKTVTSTNQTLTNGDHKPLWLDQAYLSWEPHEGCLLRAGKIENLWISPGNTQQIFDSDYTPEGIAYQHLPNNGFITTINAHWLKERYSTTASDDQGDSFTLGAQFGYGKKDVGAPWKVLASYLAFTNFKGASSITGSFEGNSNLNGVYLNDYYLGVLGGEVQFSVKKRPLLVYSELVNNFEASEDRFAAVVGATLNRSKNKGEWSMDYNFRYTEADAIFAVLSDSDVGQRADARGHTLSLKYGFSSKMSALLTNYFWEVGLSDPTWYHRINLDFIAIL